MKQFIKDKELEELSKEIILLFDKHGLRPLEREILLLMLWNYEARQKRDMQTNKFVNKTIGNFFGAFGEMRR